MEGGVCLYIGIHPRFLDAKLGYAEPLHTVIHCEELVVGELYILLLGVALFLFGLGIFYSAEQSLQLSLDECEDKDDTLEYREQNLGNTALTAGEEIGDIDRKDRDCDNHESDPAEHLDKTEADYSSDKASSHRLSAVFEELYHVEGELSAPIGYGVRER